MNTIIVIVWAGPDEIEAVYGPYDVDQADLLKMELERANLPVTAHPIAFRLPSVQMPHLKKVGSP